MDVAPDVDPMKGFAIGPDRAGNLLEVIWLEVTDSVQHVIHAMALRPTSYDLLPPAWKDTHD